MNWLRLWLLRLKRRGLLRERARLHQLAAGIAWELDRNRADAERLAGDIAAAEDALRRARWARQYRVAP